MLFAAKYELKEGDPYAPAPPAQSLVFQSRQAWEQRAAVHSNVSVITHNRTDMHSNKGRDEATGFTIT